MNCLTSAKNQFIKAGYTLLPNIWNADEIRSAHYALKQISEQVASNPENWIHHVLRQADVPEKQLIGIPENKRDQAVEQIYIIGDIAGHSQILKEMLLDARCINLARQLLGDDVICHFSNATIRAARVGCSCSWHRDWPNSYCATRAGHQIRLMICLDGMRKGQGATQIIPGSHNWDNETWNSWRKLESSKQNLTVHTLSCPPGSLIVLGPTIVHGAELNLSPRPRRNLIAQWGLISDLFCMESPESITGYVPNHD